MGKRKPSAVAASDDGMATSASATPAQLRAQFLRPFTIADDDGIWHHPVKADGTAWLAPIRLCDPFTVVGTGSDIAGQHYYLIECANGERCLIARGDVGTPEGWRLLRNVIDIPSARKKLDLLTEFIQENGASEQWTITDTAGWHDDAYILPSGEIIGQSARLYFNGKVSNDKRLAYRCAGTLDDWKSQIGRYAAGNSRLCLMLGAAFAAPLLQWLNIDGGIIHIFGESSSGKTTTQRVAQSVWGHGATTSESWNTTAYALTNNAAARNDGLLSMDEIGEDGSGRSVDQSIYSPANGKGRALGNKDGGNRPEIRFRVLCTSTGELSLESHLQKFDREIMAGQLVRCPSLPHKLENHHDFPDFKAFVNHLNSAITQYYGTAGRIYITCLAEDSDFWRETAVNLFQEYLTLLSGDYQLNAQTMRTTRIFAAAATGLVMAVKHNIITLTVDDALSGIKDCFADWYARNGQVKEGYEAGKIKQIGMDFVQTRDLLFLDPERPYMPSKDTPGYVKRYEPFEEKEDEYYIFPAIFREYFCKGFDEEKVKDVLHGLGWLAKDTGDRWQFQLYGKDPKTGKRKRLGRFYKLIGIAPPVIVQEDLPMPDNPE